MDKCSPSGVSYETEPPGEVKKRLVALAKHYGFTTQNFSISLGLSNGFLTTGKNGSVGADKLYRVKSAFPEVSLDWLVMGRGPMLLTGGDAANVGVNVALGTSVVQHSSPGGVVTVGANAQELTMLREECERLRGSLAQQSVTIANLNDLVSFLRGGDKGRRV